MAVPGGRCPVLAGVYVEGVPPAARRLHHWTLPDGSVELSRVVLHDDVQP